MGVSYRALTVLSVAVMTATLIAFAGITWAVDNLPGEWQTLASSSRNRQEVSYVQTGGKFYLAWGSKLHERYNPATNSWQQLTPLPIKLDHIQGVEVREKIYYIGGLAAWPAPHVNTVYVYDPSTDTMNQGTPMPDGRGRGAGGVAVHDGKIYYAGGLHDGKAVAWFDVYDPATGTWTQLPDMPRARDHFQGAVVDGKFYAIAGRDTFANATTPKVDVYDLSTGTGGSWQTPNTALPTPRGGFATAVLGKEILVIGGEGGGKTYNTVEAYDTTANSWRTLEPMPTARHGIQAAVCNGGVYIAAGGMTQGGANPTNVHEVFFLNGPTTCDASGDTTAPVVSKAPAQALLAKTTLSTSSTLPVRLNWAATDDSGTVAAYELQQSTNGGPFTDVALSSATTTQINRTLEAGKSYQFQVRAQDGAGNWSGWKQGPLFKVNVVQESAAAVSYTGAWTTETLSSASGGTLRHASASGALAELTFGKVLNFGWVAHKGANRGQAEAWVDGVKQKSVDLYNSSTQARRIVFAQKGLNPAVAHTLEVKVLGTKNAASSGTRVDVDAFVILSSP